MVIFFSSLEDPKYPLLGPTLWGLQTWGMWQPNKGKAKIAYNTVHIFAIVFVMSQYVELWYIRSNLEMALRNLSVTMLSTVCVVKATTFILWQKSWRNIFEFVSFIEKQQLNKQSNKTKRIINKYTKYSRAVTYFYWCLVTATVFTVILAPLVLYFSSLQRREQIRNGTIAYPEIMSSWTPFDKTRGLGYWILVLLQSLICFYGGGIVATYDSNAVVLMSFFAGQFEFLREKCEDLFGNGEEFISYNTAVKRIKGCHHHHVLLVKYSKILNSLLSPVMFLYIIICSLMICASAVQLTTAVVGTILNEKLIIFYSSLWKQDEARRWVPPLNTQYCDNSEEGTTTMQQVWIAEYLVALVAQLFLYCWHSNKVLYMSLKVDEGVYNSAWWSQGVRIRRSIMLLGGQLNKSVIFTAGPFTKLTIATFVAILKGSYSYYTLLSKRED